MYSALSLRTPNALDALVTREHVRFKYTPQTVCAHQSMQSVLREQDSSRLEGLVTLSRMCKSEEVVDGENAWREP